MSSLVSIIIPTYQGTENILMAINSALNQTYKPIEIIVVDDNGLGSECQIKTKDLLSEYILAGRIKYIAHKTNKNGSSARNTGMKAARGEYFSFLDDDDYLMPTKTEKQVRLFEQLDEDYGLVYCSGFITKPTGIGYKLDIIEDDPLYNLLIGKLRFNSSMIMIRKQIFLETGGFDESYSRHQDWEFCCRVLSKFKAKALPEHLVVKYIMDRNVPKNPDKAVQLRMYFLEKNKNIIHSLGEHEEKEILAFHMRDLALAYLLNGDLRNAFVWLVKAGNPVIQGLLLLKYAIKRKTVHREKYAKALKG